MLVVNEKKCIGCCNCHIICPVGAITLKENTIYIDNDVCVSCKSCIGDCPQNALSFNKKVFANNCCIISKGE